MKLCIFEDGRHENFYPISLTRPVFSLRMGMEELYRRDARILGLDIGRAYMRDYLAATWSRTSGIEANPTRPLEDEDWLFLNGRVMDPSGITADGPEEVGVHGADLVYARVKAETVRGCQATDLTALLDCLVQGLPQVKVDVPLASYIWDVVLNNSEALRDDFNMMGKKGIEGHLSQGSYIVGEEESVYVAPGARVDPMVVLDASEGPIYLDEGVRVFPHTRIEGPSYIGGNTYVVGGKIREGCSIGPVCRVGGEVEESIFHGHSNKYHDGFIGHAYVGEWVNLGALTTNSDLKNDYSGVQVYVRGRLVDTGSTKVGSFIGDHSKTGIGSLLNTGTTVGVMSILMPSGEVFPKNIPSFSLLLKNRIRGGLGFDTLIETARKVMARRGVELSEEEVRMLREVYVMTSEERETLIKRDRRKRSRVR